MAKPKINFAEQIYEISLRTGLSQTQVKKVLTAYEDLVKTAIINEVEVVFGKLGVFSWKFIPRHENVKLRFSEEPTNFPAHNRMIWRSSNKWKSEMKKATQVKFIENYTGLEPEEQCPDQKD